MALASHLKALGHEVQVCVPPDFRECVEGPGIPVTPISPEVRRFTASRPTATQPQTPLTSAQRRHTMEATVAAQFEALTSAAQECDVIVALPRYRWRPDRWRRCWGFLTSFSPPMRRWSCRRRIMHHRPCRPCRPYLDRLPPTTSDNSELGAQSVERRKALAS